MNPQETTTVPTTDHDTRWKELITSLFEDFLKFFMPHLAKDINFKRKAVFLDKELHSIAGKRKKKGKVEQDNLAKVWLKNGKEHWILIHIEVQSSYKSGFTKRMFTYFYRLYDKYKKPITAIAIYTGTKIPKQYDRFVYQFAGTENIYKFNTYLIRDADQAQLTKSKNPFALAVLAASYLNQAHKNAKQLYAFKVKLYELAREKGYTEHQIEALIRFIFLLIALPKKESKKFEKLVYKTQNIEDMPRPTMTEHEREQFESFAAVVYEATFGVSFEDILKQKEAEVRAEIAKKQAEIQKKEKEVKAEIQKKEEEVQTEIAHTLLNKGDYSIKEIAEITGLSQYKVRKIKRQLQEND